MGEIDAIKSDPPTEKARPLCRGFYNLPLTSRRCARRSPELAPKIIDRRASAVCQRDNRLTTLAAVRLISFAFCRARGIQRRAPRDDGDDARAQKSRCHYNANVYFGISFQSVHRRRSTICGRRRRHVLNDKGDLMCFNGWPSNRT
jgi:hypothetical protein